MMIPQNPLTLLIFLSSRLFFQSDFESLNPNSNQNPFDLMSQRDDGSEFDFRDELIRLADCFETQSFQLAQVILARLNQLLRSPT